MLNYPYEELPRDNVNALGINTNYYAAGSQGGNPIVLLHGMSTSADSFRETMHELAAEHWLIAPDIPGFGFSENTEPYTIPHLVEWLADFQEKLALPSCTLVGHSFGGVLAAAFAIRYPEEVTRLLLLAPAILSANNYPRWLRKLSSRLGLIELGSALSQSRLLVRRQIRVPFYDPSTQHESVWERRLRDYELARASPAVMRATAFYDLRPQLSRIEHPTCIVWGLEDPVVPHTDTDLLLDLLPQAEVRKLSECGHLPMLERPQPFLEIAREFLA